jgi:hypothetical protein
MSVVRHMLQTRAAFMLVLVAVALVARATIPAGWMPSVQGDRIAISICSGEGRQTMWLDKAGKLHDNESGQDHQDHPCAFASVTPALDVPVALESLFLVLPALFILTQTAVSIGQGLAAPPPPSTGPPALI